MRCEALSPIVLVTSVLLGGGCVVGAFDRDAGDADAGHTVHADGGPPTEDAGEVDAGEVDAGEVDAGEAPDAGPQDAGPFDAGPTGPQGPNTSTPFPIDRGDDEGTPGAYLSLPLRLVDNEAPDVSAVDGVIGLMCIGGKSAQLECAHFAAQLQSELADEVNAEVKVVNCGITGFSLEGIERWNDPAKDVYLWNVCLGDRLAQAGVTLEQVRVVYHRAANFLTAACGFQLCEALPPYPESGNNCTALTNNLDDFAARVTAKLPGVVAVYTSSRPYGGYVDDQTWRGEPLTYEEGHGVNTWLARNPQVSGIGYEWGPYLWAPSCASGVTNGNGICWDAADFEADGETPTAAGLGKTTALLHARLLAEPWYVSF